MFCGLLGPLRFSGEDLPRKTIMETKAIELLGKNCPFPVMHIIREVDLMRAGEKLRFLVDDPLAIKSVPEELEEYRDIVYSISPRGRYWEIVIFKTEGKE